MSGNALAFFPVILWVAKDEKFLHCEWIGSGAKQIRFYFVEKIKQIELGFYGFCLFYDSLFIHSILKLKK